MKIDKFNSRFLDFIEANNLVGDNDKILAAVSGGCDSVVMCELFLRNKIDFDIAHVNFNLRRKDSEDDEKFVRQIAARFNVKCYVNSFNTEDYAKANKISIEMAARELRYHWFHQLRTKYSYTSVAVAHHQNDNMETILLNMIKGTGIRGLHGILPKLNHVIRPLLFANRLEIENYALIHNIAYRTDKSNKDIKFQRNFIRHEVVPELKKINPNLEQTFFDNSQNILVYEQLINNTIKLQSKAIVSSKRDIIYLNIPKLTDLDYPKIFLYEYLKDFGFNNEIVTKIVDSLNRESGKKFFSKEYQLIKDRDCLILSLKRITKIPDKLIRSGEKFIHVGDVKFEFKSIDYMDFSDLKERNIAYLNYAKLDFPLKIRTWQGGDYFYPFGMTMKKKLSDYFIDNKISLNEKETILVIESKGKIAWIAGYRVDNRFKIEKDCSKVYKITKSVQ